MDPAPTPPFEVSETASGRLYRLPPRQLGGLRYLAGLPLLPAIFAGYLLVLFYLSRTAKGPLTELDLAVFVFIGIGWTRAFYSLASLAAAIWRGRTEIEVANDGAVWATDRSGWFRIRWGKLKPGAAREFVVAPLFTLPDSTGKPLTGPSIPWNLSAEIGFGRKVRLAPGHSREVLIAIADELAAHLAIGAPAPQDDPATGEPLPESPSVAVPVIVEEPEVPSRDVLEQPPNSRVVLERHPDGVTLTVPPPGIVRGQGTILLIGLGFSLLGGIALAALILKLFRGNPWQVGAEPVGAIFLLVGIGMLLAAVHLGRKRCVLAVVGDRLLTFESGPLGSRRREFTRIQLLDIACGPSHVKVNNRVLPQLQIVPSRGKHVGILTGRDETELLWLATVLRQTLRIPVESPEDSEPNDSCAAPPP